MMFHRSTWTVAAMLLTGLLTFASDKPTSGQAKMDEVTRMQLIRAINAEIVYIRRPFPMGYKGLVIKDGKVTPNEHEVLDMIAMYGPAVKPGDQARITAIQFKGDDKIIFEINGGPKKKAKWYDRIQVGSGSASTGVNPNAQPNLNARGSAVTLEFDKYVPQIGPDELKKLLYPVFDFDAKSAIEAYMDTVPPKVKDAIKNKQVLVGMNREMVTYALGRPPKKYREQDYEEWIYGTPPDPVQFVRFVGDEVVKLEIMKIDGQKIVRTEKEVDLKPTVAQTQPAAAEGQPQAAGAQPGTDTATKRPTLKRPGEAAPPVADSTRSGKLPLPGDTQRGPNDPPMTPGSGPGANNPSGAPTTGTGIPPI
jgi:outer membrane protein assembly factor BamE (lipoprotein component of BamABCDE complex)